MTQSTDNPSYDLAAARLEAARQGAIAAGYAQFGIDKNYASLKAALLAADCQFFSSIVALGQAYGILDINAQTALTSFCRGQAGGAVGGSPPIVPTNSPLLLRNGVDNLLLRNGTDQLLLGHQ